MTATSRARRPQRRRRPEPVRHDRARPRTSRSSLGSGSGRRTGGWSAPTAAPRSRASRAPAASTRTRQEFTYDADHPAVLVGADHGPDAGGVPAARARPPASRPASRTSPPPGASRSPRSKSTSRATSTCTGILGLSDGRSATATSRSGSRFHIEGDAPTETLREIVEQSRAAPRSTTCSPTASPSPSTSGPDIGKPLGVGRSAPADPTLEDSRCVPTPSSSAPAGRPGDERRPRRAAARPRRARARARRERWRTERWDSLRLLTPNWMTRLPGHRYSGTDPDGYMTTTSFIDFFDTYTTSIQAPVEEQTTVQSVRRDDELFTVRTDRGRWTADNVVVATGANAEPRVPEFAAMLSNDVAQITPSSYRNPAQLPDGGVLVVGASASGAQLASELLASGRECSLPSAGTVECRGDTEDATSCGGSTAPACSQTRDEHPRPQCGAGHIRQCSSLAPRHDLDLATLHATA